MIYGNTDKNIISLNEDTFWSGEPSSLLDSPPHYQEIAKEVAQLIRDGKNAEANDLINTKGVGKLGQAYQPVGDLIFTFNTEGKVSDYERSLNLTTAVHKVTYRQNGTTFTRETFASHPDKVIYIRLSTDGSKALDFSATFTSPHPTAQPIPAHDGIREIRHGWPGSGLPLPPRSKKSPARRH